MGTPPDMLKVSTDIITEGTLKKGNWQERSAVHIYLHTHISLTWTYTVTQDITLMSIVVFKFLT